MAKQSNDVLPQNPTITMVRSSGPEQESLVQKFAKRLPALGIILAVASGAFFCTSSAMVKMIDGKIHPVIFMICRGSISMIVYLATIVYNGESLFNYANDIRLFLVIRAFIGFWSFLLNFMAVVMIPLGDATTIVHSSPVYATIFAWIFLGESCTCVGTMLIAVTMIGIVTIAKPTFILDYLSANGVNNTQVFNATDLLNLTMTTMTPESFNTIPEVHDNPNRLAGTLVAFASSLSIAFAFITIRKLKGISAAVIIFWHSIGSVVFGIIIMCLMRYFDLGDVDTLRVPITTSEWIYMSVCVVCGIFGQLMVTSALKVEEAGIVSLSRSGDIALAFIVQAILLKNEPIEMTSVIGAVIIFIGITTSGYMKWRKERQLKILERNRTAILAAIQGNSNYNSLRTMANPVDYYGKNQKDTWRNQYNGILNLCYQK